MPKDYDVAVVGGGLLGSAIAWGLGRLGKSVAVLDEGDITKRASRANFALVWVQSKGLGMPAYTVWTVQASQAWGRLASELKQQTGLDVALQQNGGFHLTLGDDEFGQRTELVKRMHNQTGAADYKMEMLSASEVKKSLPLIGPEVSGGSYCPLDGHVNSLRTFRAFHTGFREFGIDYFPEQPVSAISKSGGEFRLTTPKGELRAAKIVLAAGNANQTLAPMVGLYAPMGPTRGQIVVTERTMPFLPHPLTTIRQTDEGTVMIGDSKEDELDDRALKHSISAVMTDRAQRMFPHLVAAQRGQELGRHPRHAAGRLSDLRPVGDASRRLRRLLPFRRDARLQPRLRDRAHGRAGRARAGAGRRVLRQPLRRRGRGEQQRLLEISRSQEASHV